MRENKNKECAKNFIYQIIENDLVSGKCTLVRTRFPPEPNGYLHIGHAKSICLNFGLAQDYKGYCNLRFDDTNPTNKHAKYIEAIKKDINWLGFQWNGTVRYSSDYTEILYLYAIKLIKKGLAYVDELSKAQIREYRGTLKDPGKNSPYRSRSIQENLFLFNKMKNGMFSEGAACLRAKINMSSSFIVMRDPVLYRIKFIQHHKTGTKWCIYPTYDFTHCISDSLEGITHSLCTLEFQDNRQLYNWILKNIDISVPPRQYEFARLNLKYTVTSKRCLKLLVEKKIVDGWDDPRMPTIAGLRRRGYTASSIREFCHRIGLTKQNNQIEISTLESCIRDELNELAPRVMAVINPVKIIINNLPKDYNEKLSMPNHPYKSEMGTRNVMFTREILIEKSDFRENITNNDQHYKRLVLGGEVRLRNSYVIKAEHIEKNIQGEIIVIYCTCDLKTLNKHPDDRKIRGVIHWVSAIYGISAEFRFYDNLFLVPNPSNCKNFLENINPNSLTVTHGFVESQNIINNANISYQFERIGYFRIDNSCFQSTHPIFHQIVSLRNISNLK
ncbi:glutamine--tRNA ligase [Blochmannia endosymbiont of Polyrhachis (Hedomyrma) turneri]|uniref:glutamine--tRNA ligase n=1 Tax=Blochmannia endosymbiont of Polyrhachis (Hedomyrma) turneri TaxID=1505596 RepID=UPI00061A7E5D|nr:glutamine--tRNA ligase [Blochmannia endosymbiont of Polyrhachis (Hedomyrma) turneri]AKC59891.1 Glutamine--tRNA ligase [Blochmannia endosymbiont of Polyrhachis (Hedomyrma) turneri]